MHNETPEDINNFLTIYLVHDTDQEEPNISPNTPTTDASLDSFITNLASRFNSESNVDVRVQRVNRPLRIIDSQNGVRSSSSYFVIFDFILNGINHQMNVERPHASLSETILIFESILAMRKNSAKMKKEHLKKFKRFRVTEKMMKESCSICMTRYKKREMARTLSCDHTFHVKCVDKWLLQHNCTCPVCRKKL
ncbi:E3 ubiquitin-protein ligase RNF13 [Vairimorpha necatrix]|uniref:E3 ubiquitin-protein ligase RNF13 n=1 Tax=Vairimorpha necatrix TaxID=6039 RepID=A0AAX4JAX6_9MICR